MVVRVFCKLINDNKKLDFIIKRRNVIKALGLRNYINTKIFIKNNPTACLDYF